MVWCSFWDSGDGEGDFRWAVSFSGMDVLDGEQFRIFVACESLYSSFALVREDGLSHCAGGSYDTPHWRKWIFEGDVEQRVSPCHREKIVSAKGQWILITEENGSSG